jgi:hypothetical protein
MEFLNKDIHFMFTWNRRVFTLFDGAAKLPKLWARSSFSFWGMNEDDWWWMMVNTPRKKRMFVSWWGDVKESLRRSSYNTKCTIFYPSSIYTAIQNVQNVEYSTIPKYTKYTEYTKYTKYTTYSTIVFYIHCNIYMFHDFCSLVEQNLASALW